MSERGVGVSTMSQRKSGSGDAVLKALNKAKNERAVRGHGCFYVYGHKAWAAIMPAFHHLLMNPMETVIEPNNIFSASGEFFFVGVGLAWCVTLACRKEIIDMNELKLRIGCE